MKRFLSSIAFVAQLRPATLFLFAPGIRDELYASGHIGCTKKTRINLKSNRKNEEEKSSSSSNGSSSSSIYMSEEDFFFSPGNDMMINIYENTNKSTKREKKEKIFIQEEDNDEDEISFELHEMSGKLKTKLLDMETSKYTPNPNTSPYEVVRLVLNALRNPDDPLPDSGYRYLLQISTPKWKQSLLKSIGAAALSNTSQKRYKSILSTAIGEALGRPHNQYGILVNEEDGNDYIIHFPSDIVDYQDGKSWLECHLLHPLDSKLLVITGWQMEQRESDGAWLVDAIDWQDFRDEFRPGIGREEWMRICG